MRSVKSRTTAGPQHPSESVWTVQMGASRRSTKKGQVAGALSRRHEAMAAGNTASPSEAAWVWGPNGGQRSRTGVTSLGQVGWPVESRAGCFCLALHTPGRGPRGWPPTGHSRQRRGRRLSLPRLPHHLSERGPAVTPRCSEDGTCSFHPGGRESPVGSVTLQQEEDPGPVWGHLWSSPPGGGVLAWGGQGAIVSGESGSL